MAIGLLGCLLRVYDAEEVQPAALPGVFRTFAGDLPAIIEGCTQEVQLQPDWSANLAVVDRVNSLAGLEQYVRFESIPSGA